MNQYLSMACLVFLIFLSGCVDELDRNKAVVKRSHEEIWSTGNIALIDELYTRDFVCHFLVGPEWEGREGLAEQVTSHRRSFPDWHETAVRLIAENDYVVAHFISSGTNQGPFAGNDPTGRPVRIHELSIYRLEDGMIAEQWGFPDIQGLSHQLGIAAPPTNMPVVDRSSTY